MLNTPSFLLCGIFALLLTITAPAAAERDARAESILRDAAEAMRLDRLESRGGILVRASGRRDLKARFQGMSHDRPDLYALEEITAVDLTDGEVMLETRGRINPDADEWLRYAFDVEGRNLLMDRLEGRAFWIGRDENGASDRFRQRIPHLLVASALRSRELTFGESARGAPARISFRASSGETVELTFSPNGHLAEAAYDIDMPLSGDVRVRWRFDDYRLRETIPYPARYSVDLDGETYVQAEVRQVRFGPLDWSELTDVGFDIPAPPEKEPARAEAAETDRPPAPPDPRNVAPGVWIVPNVRSGFHPLVVEFADFMAVVDAPSGWFELDGLPAYNFVPGGGSSATGERLLATIRALRPGKPVRYVALTHHHSDHIGGIRPFVAAGATILASPETAQMVRFAASRQHRINPDGLARSNAQPKIQVVEGTATVGDGSRELRLIDLGANPHVEGMLVAYVPDQRLLFQSDLFEPLSAANFPSVARVPVMRWFVDWLDRSGLRPEQIRAIHGSSLVTPQQMEKIRNLSSELRDRPQPQPSTSEPGR